MAQNGPDAVSVVADIGGQEIIFETGRLAKQANGSVLVRSGDSLVLVTATGAQEITSIKISKEVVDPNDVEMLQDMIVAACNDAARKVDEQLGQSMSGLMGGLKIPGL